MLKFRPGWRLCRPIEDQPVPPDSGDGSWNPVLDWAAHITLLSQFIPMTLGRRLQIGNNPVRGGRERSADAGVNVPATNAGSFGGGMDTSIGNEIQAEGCDPDDRALRQAGETMGFGRRRIFMNTLPAPFDRCQAKAFFEHGIEQTEMPVAAVVGNVDDFGIGIREQLARPLEAQFDLPGMERHAEFLPEQAAEVAFATMELPGQFRQGTFGQFGLGHLSDQFPDMIAEFIAAGGCRGRYRQKAGHGIGPELQQCATHGQPVAVGLVGQPHEFLADGFRDGENGNGRGRLVRGDFQSLPFRHGEHAVEVLQLDGEKLQLERAQLAGTNNPTDIAGGDQTITGRELPGFDPMLQPVARARRHARHQPSMATGKPFGGGR